MAVAPAPGGGVRFAPLASGAAVGSLPACLGRACLVVTPPQAGPQAT